MPDEELMQAIREAKSKHESEFLDHPDVHGIGVGYRKKAGERTDELAIVVHVENKRPEDELEETRVLPTSITFEPSRGPSLDIPIDVQQKPRPKLEVDCGQCGENLKNRQRPLPGGYSGGHTSVTAGTLGGWVWDAINEQEVLISAEHVLTDNTGEDVVQPGPLDGGSSPGDTVANVVRAADDLDASVAQPEDADDFDPEIECGPPAVYEIAEPEIGMEVQKTGRTTGLTCGIVELVDFTTDNDDFSNTNRNVYIDGDGEDFSKGGDSGSLYVEMEHPEGHDWKRVVGLHYGGAGNDGVGHPIPAVFDEMNLETLCTGVVEAVLDSFASGREESEAMALPSESFQIRSGTFSALPSNLTKRVIRERKRESFARSLRKNISRSSSGREALDFVRRNRVVVTKLLSNGEIRRALRQAYGRQLRNAITTDDFLDTKLSAELLEQTEKILITAKRIVGDETEDLVSFARRFLEGAEGKTLSQLLDL